MRIYEVGKGTRFMQTASTDEDARALAAQTAELIKVEYNTNIDIPEDAIILFAVQAFHNRLSKSIDKAVSKAGRAAQAQQ